MDIGFIGLGHMGAGVAGNLLKAGHHVRVWNRSPEAVRRLVDQGAVAAATPAEAFDAEVVFSMLASDEVIEAVIVDSGALDGARPGAVHLNLATVSVALAQRLEAMHVQRGLAYVAAPVLGRPDVAAGELNVLCAGAPEAVARVRPLLETFAKAVWPVGDQAYRANVVKLACNFALASMIETLGEAGALVAAHGIAPADLYDVMTGTLFAAPAYKTYSDIIAHQRFTPPGFKLPLGLKDVRLALAAGEAQHTPLPIASLLRDHFIEAIAQGDGEKDWSALAAGAFRRGGQTIGGLGPAQIPSPLLGEGERKRPGRLARRPGRGQGRGHGAGFGPQAAAGFGVGQGAGQGQDLV
jgi:3-hydroxyisobutyrate dehydrogenase-like beta-hydroxyacid dehydrogenase